MNFVSIQFAYFLPIVFGLWLIVRRNYAISLSMLLIASLVFYGHRYTWFVPVILAYCVIDWATGLLLVRVQRTGVVLTIGVGFNLAILCFWKYTPLILTSLASLLGRPAVSFAGIQPGDWLIPMGISFYAFTGISYMVDVYRGIAKPEPSFWRYALFTSFFAHLVAGPILRAREFLSDLKPAALTSREPVFTEGGLLISRGFFKKTVLADNIAGAIDPFFAHVSDSSTAGVWSLPYVYLYALQIYFDFSGYTDIARGIGLWFGFRWPENFNLPYLASSIQEFWRRWHMTLSRFLRDYLYVSLGGSRHGEARTVVNLMITMLLGGLWHGASWSFMIWGGLHGAYLVVHRFWSRTAIGHRLATLAGQSGRLYRDGCVVLTFNLVCLAWCFFRLTHLGDSLRCIEKLVIFEPGKAFLGGSGDVGLWIELAVYCAACGAAAAIWRGHSIATVSRWLDGTPTMRGLAWGGSLGVFILALLLSPGGTAPAFIYFQF